MALGTCPPASNGPAWQGAIPPVSQPASPAHPGSEVQLPLHSRMRGLPWTWGAWGKGHCLTVARQAWPVPHPCPRG